MEAMISRDVICQTEVINDKIDSFLSNNMWIVVDMTLGSRPIGYMDFQKEV